MKVDDRIQQILARARPRHASFPRGTSLRLAYSVKAGLCCLCLLACDGSQDPAVEARELIEAQQYEPALALLREQLERSPGDPEINHLYGLALLQNRQAGLAAWPLRRAAEDPDHAIASGLLLGRALILTNNGYEALRTLNELLEVDPDNLDAVRLRARARRMAHDEEGAIDDIERLLEASPGDLSLIDEKLNLEIKLERLDDAEQTLERLEQGIEGREDIPERSFAHVCARKGELHALKGDLTAAEGQFESCRAEHADNVQVLRAAARFFDAKGEPERATALISDAADAHPERLDLQNWLAARMAATGEFERTEEILRAAAKRLDTPAAWTLLRDHYVDQEDLAGAQEAIDGALNALTGVHPTAPEFSYALVDQQQLFEYADILVQLGAFERTAAMLEHIDEPAFRLLLQARTHYEQGDYARALELWEQAFAYWPSNAGGRFLASRAALKLHAWERATSHMRESLRTDAAATNVGWILAQFQLAQGHPGAAFDALSHHLRGHPDDEAALRLYARLASQSGREEAAQNVRLRLINELALVGEAHADHARDMAAGGGHEAALAFLEEQDGGEVLDLESAEHSEALRAWWELMVALGRGGDALERVERVASAHPDHADLQALYGVALVAVGRHEDADGPTTRALELEPDAVSSLVAMVSLELARENLDGAIAVYDRWIALEPDAPEPAFAAGLLLVAHDRIEESRERLKSVLDEWPWRGDAAHQLALIALERGDVSDDSLSLAEWAAGFPGVAGPVAFQTLGRIRLARDDPAGAAEALQLAIASGASGPLSQYQLGLALKRTGNQESARQAFEAALGFEHFDEFDAVRAELAKLDGPVQQSSPAPVAPDATED